MKALRQFCARTVAVMADNIDTDIIIPKNYLKSIFKTGFGPFAFDPWRYHADRSLKEDFPLNQAQHQGAGILITGDNFGCGSSREHAAWAIQDAGIRVIIAGSYSDIFRNNWLNNGNLPIVQSKEIRERLAKLPADESLCIDLEAKEIRSKDAVYPFDIEENWRNRLMNGLDSISLTLQHEQAIADYEARQAKWK